MRQILKAATKALVRQSFGRLPRSSIRLTGPLAIHGGTPVRDLRMRPWPKRGSQLRQWLRHVEPRFRAIYLTGEEGLPQTLQKQFAREWATYCETKYALMLPHGTDALRIAIAATLNQNGLEYGGEVIVPNLSFIASATAALDRRLSVALVDVEAETLNLDPTRTEEAIRPGITRAIIPVHQFGQPANMDALGAIAKKYGLRIIEDAAQAHGAKWQSSAVGSLSDAAAFSFQSAKNLSCGEGGVLTTSSLEIYEKAYAMHNAGRSATLGTRWEHESLGWNCRPTEYQAALLLHRLREFERLQEKREGNFKFLRQLLSRVTCLSPVGEDPRVSKHGMYMFVVRYHFEQCGGTDIEEFIKAVSAEGVPLYRCYSSTIANQKLFKDLLVNHPAYVRLLPTPIADLAVTQILYIPADVFLGTRDDMEDILAGVEKVERHFRANARSLKQ